MDELLSKFQQWYASQCDGDWEHGYGIEIVMLDNPGWRIKINLSGTELEGRAFEPITKGLSPDLPDWHSIAVKDNTFDAAGDPSKLTFILETFLDWAMTERSSETPQMKITGAATVFPVRDVAASVRFFTEKLGFRQKFVFGRYAGVERDGCLIHLSQSGNPNTTAPGSGCVYLFCDNADAFYADLKSRGATPSNEPKDYPYGMCDFLVEDPDGNKISIGSPTPSATPTP